VPATIEREQMQQEALTRAVSGQALTNWPVIIQGFMAKGIPEDDIRPRENVFTYHAWRALGRQVRRGEHGVKVVTYVTVKSPDTKDEYEAIAGSDVCAFSDPKLGQRKGSYRRPWTATVFHVSQTDPIES
jgi:hypothetical protein